MPEGAGYGSWDSLLPWDKGSSLRYSPLSLGRAQMKQELAWISPQHLPTALMPSAKLVFRVQRVPERWL